MANAKNSQPRSFKPRPATLDHLKSVKARTATVRLARDPDLVREADELHGEWQAAKRLADAAPDDSSVKSARDDLAKQYDAVMKRVEEEDAIVTLKFRALSRVRYDKLLTSHQPTDEQKEQWGPGIAYNVDTFPPALLAAASVEPKFSESEAKELFDSEEMGNSDLEALFLQVLTLQTAPTSIPGALGKG